MLKDKATSEKFRTLFLRQGSNDCFIMTDTVLARFSIIAKLKVQLRNQMFYKIRFLS